LGAAKGLLVEQPEGLLQRLVLQVMQLMGVEQLDGLPATVNRVSVTPGVNQGRLKNDVRTMPHVNPLVGCRLYCLLCWCHTLECPCFAKACSTWQGLVDTAGFKDQHGVNKGVRVHLGCCCDVVWVQVHMHSMLPRFLNAILCIP
jgi:hypothetical protein